MAFGLLVALFRYDEVLYHHKHEKTHKFVRTWRSILPNGKGSKGGDKRDNVKRRCGRFERKVDMRYYGQAYEFDVTVLIFGRSKVFAGLAERF